EPAREPPPHLLGPPVDAGTRNVRGIVPFDVLVEVRQARLEVDAIERVNHAANNLDVLRGHSNPVSRASCRRALQGRFDCFCVRRRIGRASSSWLGEPKIRRRPTPASAARDRIRSTSSAFPCHIAARVCVMAGRPTTSEQDARSVLMPYAVDFNDVSTVGLESSPVAAALAGLRANEARYFKNKYDHDFRVEPASNAKTTI